MAQAGHISVQIPANESISGGVDLGSNSLFAFEMPESWAGTTITFQAKAQMARSNILGGNDEDWDNVYDDNGTELSVTVASNRVVGLRADAKSILAPIRYLRIRSGTSAAPVGQNPAKEIIILTKE